MVMSLPSAGAPVLAWGTDRGGCVRVPGAAAGDEECLPVGGVCLAVCTFPHRLLRWWGWCLRGLVQAFPCMLEVSVCTTIVARWAPIVSVDLHAAVSTDVFDQFDRHTQFVLFSCAIMMFHVLLS